MRARLKPADGPSANTVLTKAVIRAGDRLHLRGTALSKIIGLSGATVTRMRRGEYTLNPNEKSFELSALFVRLYRSLDAIVGGDDEIAARWLTVRNSALGDTPINLIQTVRGLARVLDYLDARRALV